MAKQLTALLIFGLAVSYTGMKVFRGHASTSEQKVSSQRHTSQKHRPRKLADDDSDDSGDDDDGIDNAC